MLAVALASAGVNKLFGMWNNNNNGNIFREVVAYECVTNTE